MTRLAGTQGPPDLPRLSAIVAGERRRRARPVAAIAAACTVVWAVGGLALPAWAAVPAGVPQVFDARPGGDLPLPDLGEETDPPEDPCAPTTTTTLPADPNATTTSSTTTTSTSTTTTTTTTVPGDPNA